MYAPMMTGRIVLLQIIDENKVITLQTNPINTL